MLYLFICSIFQLVSAHAGLHLQKDDFEFNGASDFLQIPPNPILDSIRFTQHLSIEVTLQIVELDRQQSIIEKYGCSSSQESGGFFLRINPNNVICFAILNSCVDYVEYCGQTVLKLNSIYHIAATYAEGKVSLLINGTYDFSQTDGAQVATYGDSSYLTE